MTIADNDDPVPNPSGPFYLAEGATGPFFELEFAVANPNNVPAPIRASFLKEDGSDGRREHDAAADVAHDDQGQRDPVPEAASKAGCPRWWNRSNGLTLVVERTMFWNRTGPYYGGHTERAGEGARRQWFFAEGSQGFFDTFLLLANPQADGEHGDGVVPDRRGRGRDAERRAAADVAAAPIHTGSDPLKALIGQSFGITVEFEQPGAAERAMYFGARAVLERGARVGGGGGAGDELVSRRGRDRPVLRHVHSGRESEPEPRPR